MLICFLDAPIITDDYTLSLHDALPISRPWRYLADWVRGTVRMYTESATRKRTATLNAVTGRSASMIVEVVAGITSVSQGDAASWRRNVVNAWMSTVLPVIQIRTCGRPVESVAPGPTGREPGAPGATLPPPAAEIPVSQV